MGTKSKNKDSCGKVLIVQLWIINQWILFQSASQMIVKWLILINKTNGNKDYKN